MVTPWQARFFGEIRLQRGEEVITRFRSQKTAALFAFLACNRHRDHGREELIARFWPDEELDDGRNSLRVALSSLRRLLEPPPTARGDVLLATRTHVRLRPGTVLTDVAAFEAALAAGDREKAVSLFDQGPFLPGNYEEWVLEERERLTAVFEGMSTEKGRNDKPETTRLPPPVGLPVALHNLPLTVDAFFGREEELAVLTMRLCNPAPEARLITIAGTGGMGKTRLAVEAAYRLFDSKTGSAVRTPFPGGVWYVPLAGERDSSTLADTLPRLLCQAIAMPSDIRRDPWEQIGAHLAGHAALFLLDNLEQVAAGAANVLPLLLQRLPSVTLLVTSRVRLGIRGEFPFALSPLPLPEVDSSLETLAETPSTRLFVARAREAESDFSLTARNAADITALLRLLEGVPLAIELTASWANVLTPRQMREQIEKRLDAEETTGRSGAFAARSSENRVPRHRSLYAAFQWSYDLLEPDVQRLLTRLSIFRGGFSTEAVEAVTGIGAASALLGRLHSHSLLTGRPTPDGSTMRFALLESLREFAEAYLPPEDRAALAARHTTFYLQFAESLKPLYGTAETVHALDRMEQEQDNLRAALDRAAFGGADMPDSLRLASAMQWYWRLRGPLAEGRRYLTEILARYGGGPDSEAEADTLNALGAIALIQRDMAEARIRFTRSLEMCRSMNYQTGHIAALSNLATTCMEEGDFDTARPLFEESLSLVRASGNRGREATVLNNLGNLAHWQRDLETATAHHSAALEIRRESADPRGISLSQVGLGILAMERGNFVDARNRLCDALRIQQELGDRSQIDTALENIARAEEGLGNLEQGITLRSAAHALRQRLAIASPPLRQEALDAEMALLRERMPAASLQNAWDRGAVLSLEETITFALRNDV